MRSSMGGAAACICSLRKSLGRVPIEQKFSVSDVMTCCRVVLSKNFNLDFGASELNFRPE
jgi:hypothetical protein